MTADDSSFVARLGAALAQRPAARIEPGSLRPAAVLICLVENPEGYSILFSKRSDELPVHSGQISFPGGAIEDGETPEQAALREAEEEVGIPRGEIELIGRLDDLVARSGFIVAPIVGVTRGNQRYVLQPTEVVEAFEAPLEILLDPENPEIRYVGYKGKTFPIYFYHYDSKEIWGITGRILKSFLDVVRLV